MSSGRMRYVVLAGLGLLLLAPLLSSLGEPTPDDRQAAHQAEIGVSGFRPRAPTTEAPPPLAARAKSDTSVMQRRAGQAPRAPRATEPAEELPSAGQGAPATRLLEREPRSAGFAPQARPGTEAWRAEQMNRVARPTPQAGTPETPAFKGLLARWHDEGAAGIDAAASELAREYLLETARATELDDETVQSAECRDTLCRVELQFDGLREAAEFKQSAQRPDLSYELSNEADGAGLHVVVMLDKQSEVSEGQVASAFASESSASTADRGAAP